MKFSNQKCIHCLSYFKILTKDHIFPKSWYPDSTPQNIEKWTAPACLRCNGALKKVEEDLYMKFAACMSSEDIASSGISKKVIQNYFFINQREDDEETTGRKIANLKNFMKEVKTFDNSDLPKNIMKNFGNVQKGSKKSMLVNISNEALDTFCKKVVKGLEFKLMGDFIGGDIIKLIHLPNSVESLVPELSELNKILENGWRTNIGPGFCIKWAKDMYKNVLYHVVIWGRFEILAAVNREQTDNIEK